jgi:DNA-directed RNA polymerase subunit alpha
MSPAEAVSTGAKILTSHLNFFAELSDSTSTEFFGENIVKESTTSNSLELENFGLSTRSYNGLKSAGIKYLSQLTEMTLGQLKEIDRLGSNSIKEIKNILTKNGLSLKKN